MPAAMIGGDLLANTTGRGMARAQGYPSLQFAVFPHSITAADTEPELKQKADLVVPQVERILTG